jgi:phenylpyruvate tautomerase PptA (4-oxalocrotonate tautomerase family)
MIIMPLVKIEILKGKSTEYKKELLEGIHRALVETLKIPENDRFQRLYELDYVNFQKPPERTGNITIIEISLFPGRSKESKKNLEESPGIMGYDIMILLKEPPLHNWGIRGGLPADEVDLGFDVEI